MEITTVEYLPENGMNFDNVTRGPYSFVGVGLRKSDGYTVLSLRAPEAKRVFNIPVGNVYAITIDGKRHVMETPFYSWSLRAAELRRIIEGFTEVWVVDYFDPNSPKYFKHQIGDKPIHLMDNYRRIEREERAKKNAVRKASSAQSAGCTGVLAIVSMVPLGAAILMLWK